MKDAACLCFHSSYLHTGEIEREAPTLIRSVHTDDHSLLTYTYAKVMFSSWMGDFYFILLIPRFAYHSPTEIHNTWLCLTKLNFLALIYHILAPRNIRLKPASYKHFLLHQDRKVKMKKHNLSCRQLGRGGGEGPVVS